MRKILVAVLLLATTMAVYARQSKKKKKTKANDITMVSIHRTLCFGHCPDYKIEIDKDGTATYTGIRFTEDTGIFKKNIGAAKAKEVFDQFKMYRVDTCQDNYENRIPDLPGLIITVQYGKKTQTIYNAHFGPRFLKGLAETVDAAGKKTDNSWKKTGDITPP